MSQSVYTHNHMTIIWDAVDADRTAHASRLLTQGKATTTQTSVAETFKLEDDDDQLSYHISRDRTVNSLGDGFYTASLSLSFSLFRSRPDSFRIKGCDFCPFFSLYFTFVWSSFCIRLVSEFPFSFV
jgi:hypothetical protein